MSNALYDLAGKFVKARPEVRPGFTVRVHERIQEGGKERVQVFEGLVISVHKGMTPTDSTITVRKIASGVGVEKVFSLHSPKIEKIEVKKVASVRRAKLFFLRGRRGKAARLSERFTTAGEFEAVAPPQQEAPEVEDVVEEAPEAADQAPEVKVEAEAAPEAPAEVPAEAPAEETPAEEEKPVEEAVADKPETEEEKKEEA